MDFMKWKILKLLLCLHCAAIMLVGAISPQIQTSVYKGIPDNWATSVGIDPFVKIGEKFYYISMKQAHNWYTAAYECRRRNANLASIESSEELDALNEYLINNNLIQWFWISGNDLGKEGEFYWMGTGNPVTFTRWAQAQPDNFEENEHCLILRKEGDQFLLSDWNCSSPTKFICEAKTPTTIALTIW